MTIQLAAIATSGGLAVTASALGTTLLGFFLLLSNIMAGKRRKRDTLNAPEQIEEEQMVKTMMYKVLNELDHYDCTALALCDAIALPDRERSPVQSSLVNMLSPQSGAPMDWANVSDPSAKYQYAAFMGLWGSVTNRGTTCRQVFSRCPYPPSEILGFMANTDVLPCQGYMKNMDVVKN